LGWLVRLFTEPSDWGSSPKGCQIVAGGRSVAKTTGQQSKIIPHPERVARKKVAPLRGTDQVGALLSGGLRDAATTGYDLTTFQAEIRVLRCHTVSVAPDPRINLDTRMNPRES
jgi:hypothetical protein